MSPIHLAVAMLGRRRLLLAAGVLLYRVLASEPVYAQAPPRSTDVSSRSKASPTGSDTSRDAATAPNATRSQSSTSTDAAPARASSTKASSTTASSSTAASPSAARGSSTTSSSREAQPSTRGAAGSSARATASKGAAATKARGGGKKTVIKDEFLIEGKLEKPSAYYILRRSEVDFDWARLGATFSPLVLESVQDPLF